MKDNRNWWIYADWDHAGKNVCGEKCQGQTYQCGLTLRQSDTGVVTQVEKYFDGNWAIFADWDVAGKNVYGGYCENMELID